MSDVSVQKQSKKPYIIINLLTSTKAADIINCYLHLLIDFHNYAIERLDVRWKDDTKTKLAQFRYVVTWETIVEFIKPKRGSGEYGAGF